MKKVKLTALIGLLCMAVSLAQKPDPKKAVNICGTDDTGKESRLRSQVIDENTVYAIAQIDTKPEFPNGMEPFYAFLKDNYKMPAEPGLNGEVFVTFIIEKDGSLSKIKTIRDIGFGTGAELVRALSLSPKWKPGMHNGKLIRVYYKLPFMVQTKE